MTPSLSSLLRIEARRLWAHRGQRAMLVVGAALMLLAAVAAGRDAAAWRTHADTVQQHWQGEIDVLHRSLVTAPVEAHTPAAARQAFEFGRTHAPPLLRPAGDGLVLSAAQFTRLPAEARATLVSRHVDARDSGPLEAPVQAAGGAPDLVVVIALLLPLLVIGLGGGLLAELREQGVWRAVTTSSPSPWRLLAVAIALRGLLAAALAILASALAFALDPASGAGAFVAWSAMVLLFVLVWSLLVAVANLLPLSAASHLVALLGLWLATTFAVPAALSAAGGPGPSRLQAVVEVRAAQEQASQVQDALLAAWYRDHDVAAPASITHHAWPVSFVPRYLKQDRRILPLMRGFDAARVERAEAAAPWLGLSPSLALVAAADRLAGVDPRQQLAFVDAVDAWEGTWRDFVVPRVMGYGGITADDLAALPTFEPAPVRVGLADIIAALLVPAAVLLLIGGIGRGAAAATGSVRMGTSHRPRPCPGCDSAGSRTAGRE